MAKLKDTIKFENIPSRDSFEDFSVKMYFKGNLLATCYCNDAYDKVLIYDIEVENLAKYLSLDKKNIRKLVKEYLFDEGYTVD